MQQHFIRLFFRQHVNYEKISDFPHPPKMTTKKPNAIKLSKQLSFFYNSFFTFKKGHKN